MRERSLKIALVCLGVAVVAYSGCSDGGTTTGSTAGDTSSSTNTGGAGGTGTTTSSTTTSVTSASTGVGGSGGTGTSTSATTTSTSSTTTSSSSISASASASASSGGNVDTLGIACNVDADCGGVFKCFSSAASILALGGGGPANGYCSKDCATDGDCPGLGGLCVGASSMSAGLCLLSCDTGPQLTSLDESLDPSKCHGREDVRCMPIAAGSSVCVPTCGRDDQCAAGRVCDPGAAVCVDVAHPGLPMGAKCNPAAPMPECAGQCINFSGGETMCSSPCVLGGDFSDLLAVADCGGLDKGLCAFSPAGNGAGDLGLCAPACEMHSDCQNPTFWCSDVGLPNNGYCFGATPCPNGQAACQSPDKCTATKYGPFCLDTTYPLGTAALVAPGPNN